MNEQVKKTMSAFAGLALALGIVVLALAALRGCLGPTKAQKEQQVVQAINDISNLLMQATNPKTKIGAIVKSTVPELIPPGTTTAMAIMRVDGCDYLCMFSNPSDPMSNISFTHSGTCPNKIHWENREGKQ